MPIARWGRTLQLAWDANPGGDNVTHYELYFGSSSGVYGTPINVGNVTYYALSMIGKPSPMFLALKAVNAIGPSASYSNEVQYP